ncbi:MAG: hypothetical protein ACO1QR_11365 [Chthoniobacteraceae bacterium]
MTAGKALIASVLIGSIVVGGSVLFVAGDAGPGPRTAASADRAVPNPPQREEPIVLVSSTAASSRTAGLPPKQANSADESLGAIHEDASALAVKLSNLSSSQAQTEARIQEIAIKFLGSPVEVPSYEQQQVKVGEYAAEVEQQRQTVEKYEKEAYALAREYGIPDSVVQSNVFREVEGLPRGRSFPGFTTARTRVIHYRKILEAAKARHERMLQIRTLPPKTR